MTKTLDTSKMCEEFQDLFKYFVPGIDFIILDEKEKQNYEDSGELATPYNMDFDDIKEKIRIRHNVRHVGHETGRNGGVFSAFDAATKTFVVSARMDIYDAVWGANDDGLFVPFSQHDTVPADAQKAAAFLYQNCFRHAQYYEEGSKLEKPDLAKKLEWAEQAEKYKAAAMGEEIPQQKDTNFLRRLCKAEKFMESEEQRCRIAKASIEEARSEKILRRFREEEAQAGR